MTTTPFAAEVADLVATAHEQLLTIKAHPPTGSPLTLMVESAEIVWDESTSPRVTARVVVPAASLTHDDLTRLDPRDVVRVKITAGYRLSNGDANTAQIADLGLRDRTLRRPDDVVELLLSSDEAAVIDAGEGWYRFGYTEATGPNAGTVIGWHIGNALAYGPYQSAGIIDTTPDLGPVTYVAPADYWSGIVELADAIDADVYDEGDRVFRIAPRPTLASTSRAILRTGPGGTILASTARLSRDEWANSLVVYHQWTDPTTGTSRIVPGIANLPSGHPRALAAAGSRVVVIQRDTPTTAERATAAAKVLLRRAQERARGYDITARSHLWLRPGQTVTVQLPTGDQERHIIARAAFDLTAATMTLSTRLPDNATPTGE